MSHEPLDMLIDEYLRHEQRHKPRLGYPRRASGTGDSGKELLPLKAQFYQAGQRKR